MDQFFYLLRGNNDPVERFDLREIINDLTPEKTSISRALGFRAMSASVRSLWGNAKGLPSCPIDRVGKNVMEALLAVAALVLSFSSLHTLSGASSRF